MKVYKSDIQICLEPVFSDARRYDHNVRDELGSLHGRCVDPVEKEELKYQDYSLVELFWKRSDKQHKIARENGYLGSYHNCAFTLLYGAFGADIIAYLFNRKWVPSTTVDPFLAGDFLQRLSVLEGAATGLKDGAETPVRLPETAPYSISGMGPELEFFREKIIAYFWITAFARCVVLVSSRFLSIVAE
jgi:hypothetical protein